MEKVLRLPLLFMISIFPLGCENSHPSAEEILQTRAEMAISNSFPHVQINELSYVPISFEKLVPIYLKRSDIDAEIKEINELINKSDTYIQWNVNKGVKDNDYLRGDIRPMRSNMYLDRGYFSIDDFILGNSFFDRDDTSSLLRNSVIHFPLFDNYSRFFTNIGGNMLTGSFSITLQRYKDEVRNGILPLRKAELQKKKADLIDDTTIIGYSMKHKYNASNKYGGIETKTETFYFDRECRALWYFDSDEENVHIIGEHLY